jgi:hypothetical protein
MGEDLLYSRFSPRGKDYYIARFPGGKATMGEKLLYNTGTNVPQWDLKPRRKDHQIIAPDVLTTAPRRRLIL